MPREIIHDDRNLPGTDNSTPLAVSVNWIRDGIVQLATFDLRARDTEGVHEGWFVDLPRQQINQLIRVLRKARDQAYGVDE